MVYYPVSVLMLAGIIANARGLACFKNFRTRVLFFLGKLDLSQA